MCGDTSIPAPELRQKLQQLQQLDTESQQTLMAAQFEVCTSVYTCIFIRVMFGKEKPFSRLFFVLRGSVVS